MMPIGLIDIADKLEIPRLKGKKNRARNKFALNFLPDAYNCKRCDNGDANYILSSPGGMGKFVRGNLQTTGRSSGYAGLTYSLLENLCSKDAEFTDLLDGKKHSYYESMRTNIKKLADYEDNPLTAESAVWELIDVLKNDEAVYQEIAAAISKKKDENNFTDALFLLVLSAIFTLPTDIANLSYLWSDGQDITTKPSPNVPAKTVFVAKKTSDKKDVRPKIKSNINPPSHKNLVNGYPEQAADALAILTNADIENNKVALVGMSGVGKSSLAAMIVGRFKGKSDKKIFWMNWTNNFQETLCDDRYFYVEGYNSEQYKYNPDAYFMLKLQELQRQGNENTLVVIDGCNASDENLESFLEGQYPVLITTQQKKLSSCLKDIEITHFPKPEKYLELFRREYDYDDIDETKQEALLNLMASWDYHTYAICLLAQSIRTNPTIWEDITALNQSDMKLPTTSFYSKLYEFLLVKHFTEEDLKTVLYILRNLALLPESGIDRMTFGKWIGFTRKDDQQWSMLQTLIDRKFIIQNRSRIHLHEIVVKLALYDLKDAEWCENLTKALFAACEDALNKPYAEKLQLREYAQSVYERAKSLSREAFRQVRWDAGIYFEKMLEMLGKFEESATVLKTLRENDWDNVYGAEMKVRLLASEAHSWILSGDLEKGTQCLESAEPLVGKLLEENSSEDLRLIVNPVYQYFCESARFKRNDKAIEYGKKAVEILEVQPTQRQAFRSLGWSYYHLGCALYVKGSLADSKECFNQAIDQFEKIKERYSSLYADEMLSQIAMQQADRDEAIKKINESRNVLQECVGKSHTDYGRNLLYEGNIYRWFDDKEKATQSYTEAIKIFCELKSDRAKAAQYALEHPHCIITDIWEYGFTPVDMDEIRLKKNLL